MTIKTSEPDVLSCLSDTPQSQAEIANKLGIHRSNVTRWLHKLESKGVAKKTSVGQWVVSQTQQHNKQAYTRYDLKNSFDAFFRKYHPDIDPNTQLDFAFHVLVDDFEGGYLDIIDADVENRSMASIVLSVLEFDKEALEEEIQKLKEYRLRQLDRNKHN